MKYPHDVKLVYKNFPIRSHKYAVKAATAALAAGRQEKFWEFHDKLFENYNQLNPEKIQTISQDLGLDAAKFAENMKDAQLIAAVDRDQSDGNLAGVRGTPAVFINGKLLRNTTLRAFQAKIESELQKIRGTSSP